MISQSIIQKLALKMQTTEQNIRREYIQSLFLSYFYQQPESNNIFFKGGTALRIVYGSSRFSEDLDFSSTLASMKKIEDILIQTIREIEREGIKADIEESKKTSGGYLAIVHFLLDSYKLAIQLEISQRDLQKKGEVKTIINDFILPFTLIALKKEQLIKEKIQALLTRKKARDFYDLYYILRANLLPIGEKNILKKVLTILNKSNIYFEKELKQFLPKSHWVIIRSFKKTLEDEIQDMI